MRSRALLMLTLLAGSLLAATEAAAEPTPTSDLLLPYFEVDLTGFKRTTLFTVTNAGDLPVGVKMEVNSNWGIVMQSVEVDLGPKETRGFNLRDWLLLGELPQPDGTLAALAPQRLSHLKTALSGQRSPEDQLYYSTQVLPDMAVGYVTLRAQGANRDDVLWGNYYIIDPEDDSAQGDVLADIDPAHHCHDLCDRHLLFFLDGGVFDSGTEIIVWNPGRGVPQPTADAAVQVAGLNTVVRNLPGDVVATDSQGLLATQTVTMADLVTVRSGSMELETIGAGLSSRGISSFIGIRYGAEHRYSVGLQSWCQPEVTGGSFTPDRIAIDLEKLTNGEDADQAPGPRIPIGDPVQWEYVVRNTGNLTLADVTVTDDQGVEIFCPSNVLEPGKQMTCTGSGIAQAGQYANVGFVQGKDSRGRTTGDSDPSHYFGYDDQIGIDIEKATNGQDADQPTGPEIEVGHAVTWTYVIKNTGQVTLSQIVVQDDREGIITCPKTTLSAGESMLCRASGVAQLGQYANEATVTGEDASHRTATDRDPSHYLGVPEPPIGIGIEKSTNGQDADEAPGPGVEVGSKVTWTYRVLNTGQVTLFDVAVDDDQEGSISCPKSTLAAGESMLCMKEGVAQHGQYANLATATGRDDRSRTATDEDPSHYKGVPIPPIDVHLEKSTNGHDADSPYGPEIPQGDPVTWTYVVTNTGEVTLLDVAVTDDREGAITCPKTSLSAGESMTCTKQGIAQKGAYANLGTVTGRDSQDRTTSDQDPSHYKGIEQKKIRIDIEKSTNGHDADSAPGPDITAGDSVKWRYVVRNTGEVSLYDIAVTDDREGSISCPKSSLSPGESMTCEKHGTAQVGQYANKGTVTGHDDKNRMTSDEDPSHYIGVQTCLPDLTFDKDAYGHHLGKGTIVAEQWASQGIHVTSSDQTHHPAMIFDSSSPTGGDSDLGSPNKDFGGPGVGNGGRRGHAGENSSALGKILIISEDGDTSDPDDNANGGRLIFTFDQPTRIDQVQLLDIDDNSEIGTVKAYDGDGHLLTSSSMRAVGDNGFQTLDVGAQGARKLEVKFPKSGALPAIVFCASHKHY